MAPVADPHEALLEAVADEQVLDDGDDLLPAQEVEAVPPALELQEALALGLDVGEQVGVLLPDGFRPEVLEVLDEPGAVEAPLAEVRQQVDEPGAADEAAGDPHRVDAGLPGPVGQGRTVEDRRADEAGAVGGQDRYRPSGLAVAVQDRRLPRVTIGDLLDEAPERVQDIEQGLAGDRLRPECHEVDRMPGT